MTIRSELGPGMRVLVTGYGYGARLSDTGRTGTLLANQDSAVRVKVSLDPGDGYEREVRSIDPSRLRILNPPPRTVSEPTSQVVALGRTEVVLLMANLTLARSHLGDLAPIASDRAAVRRLIESLAVDRSNLKSKLAALDEVTS